VYAALQYSWWRVSDCACMCLQLCVADTTVADWYAFCRDLCSWDLLSKPTMLGGDGQTVAIDKLVAVKTNPVSGRNAEPVPAQWVFGAVDIGTGEFFMELVQRCDVATLLPVVQRNVLTGTRVLTEELPAYGGLAEAGYIHEIGNPVRHFVEPVTGVHTKSIRARWAACNLMIRRRYGVPRVMLAEYLDDYMWRSRRPRARYFDDILDVIRRRYPV